MIRQLFRAHSEILNWIVMKIIVVNLPPFSHIKGEETLSTIEMCNQPLFVALIPHFMSFANR
jgi:hypothetical protein